MYTGDRPALHSLQTHQIFGECLDAVFHARQELDCVTPDDDVTENVVNVHLANVLSQGFSSTGLHSLPDSVWNLRQTVLKYEMPDVRRRHAWQLGVICLFVYSQQEPARVGRHGMFSRDDAPGLLGLGSHAFLVAASYESPSIQRDAVYRLSNQFPGYGRITSHAGMIMGFHDHEERLLRLDHPVVTLEDVLEAISRFSTSQNHEDWIHLCQMISQYHWYHPDFTMEPPPEPEM